MKLWGPTGLKYIGQNNWLEIQVAVDVEVLNLNSTGQARLAGNSRVVSMLLY